MHNMKINSSHNITRSDYPRWPDELTESYRRRKYWRDETLDQLLRRHSNDAPERTAIWCAQQRISYGELDYTVDRLAAGLQHIGIKIGDRVVAQLPNIPEFITLCFALFRIGAIPVLALPTHRENEILHLCQMSEAVAYARPEVVAGFDYSTISDTLRRKVRTVRHILVAGHSKDSISLADLERDPVSSFHPGPEPGDPAMLLLSGGTTAAPKLIPRTHQDYAYNIRLSVAACQLTETDVYLTALPMAHNFALGCPGVLGVLSAGGQAVLTTDPSPGQSFGLIERAGVTVTALVPPLAVLWMEEATWSAANLSSLRLLQVGGSKLRQEHAERIQPVLGCRLQQVFGMAEGLLCCTRLDDPDELVMSTQGKPLSPADEIRVVDQFDRQVEPGDAGHLLVRGPYTIRGYYRAPEYNSTAFTAEGFYRTGDIVRCTPTGHLVVEGRLKDVINRGGDKVPVEDIESHLLTHSAVHDVAIVGIPDPLMGERTCACIIARGEPPTFAEINAFLRNRGLATYKLPDRLEIVESFPLTGVGKVDKRRLAAELAS